MTQIYARPGTSPTARELEVATAVLEADSMGGAAAVIGISEQSVRAHLANLRVRLGARHNAELFFKLREHLVARGQSAGAPRATRRPVLRNRTASSRSASSASA